MTCHYCRAQNDVDAHRCNRCGRRTMDRTPVQMTAAVPNLETVEMPAPPPAPLRPQLVTEIPPKRPSQPAQPAFQASLFGPMEATRLQSQPAEPAAPPAKRSSPRVRRDQSRQQRLDLQEPERSEPQLKRQCTVGLRSRLQPIASWLRALMPRLLSRH